MPTGRLNFTSQLEPVFCQDLQAIVICHGTLYFRISWFWSYGSPWKAHSSPYPAKSDEDNEKNLTSFDYFHVDTLYLDRHTGEPGYVHYCFHDNMTPQNIISSNSTGYGASYNFSRASSKHVVVCLLSVWSHIPLASWARLEKGNGPGVFVFVATALHSEGDDSLE